MIFETDYEYSHPQKLYCFYYLQNGHKQLNFWELVRYERNLTGKVRLIEKGPHAVQ